MEPERAGEVGERGNGQRFGTVGEKQRQRDRLEGAPGEAGAEGRSEGKSLLAGKKNRDKSVVVGASRHPRGGDGDVKNSLGYLR